MAITTFFVILLQRIIQYLQMVGKELVEAVQERMEQWRIYLSQKMAQLLQELVHRSLEQSIQEQSGMAWGSLLFAALQYQPFWAIAALLVLLVGLCWWFRRWRHQAYSSRGYRDEEEDDDDDDDQARFIAEHIQLPVQDIIIDYKRVRHLVNTYIHIIRELSADSCSPVLEKAIGVGSAFEGWSPLKEDTVYRVLIPMKPPTGHAFHLEQSTANGTEARTWRIRVELLRTVQEPSLLYTLCTDSYLDVQKTTRWFQELVEDAWLVLSLTTMHRMELLPSNHSYRVQLRRHNKPMLTIEMILGVQLDNSDIFVSNESTEASSNSNTMWPDTYAVAEVKFFRHIARRAPRDSCHLKCLQLCADILDGSGFSIYTFKTAVMHLLTTIPLSNWRSEHCMDRLQDIMSYLRCCLEEKRLNHFFFGNENVPEEILLPTSFQNVVPPNLFHHLAQDPDSLPEALRDFYELQNRLSTFLMVDR